MVQREDMVHQLEPLIHARELGERTADPGDMLLESKRWLRWSQSEGDSSDSTRALPAFTGMPTNSPPLFIRSRRRDSKVVLPVFH